MPKADYAKCKFYRIICRDPTVLESYVGHTCGEAQRRQQHKKNCNNERSKGYNRRVYRFIREHGGWDNWQLLVHEHLAVNGKIAATLRERFWFEHYQATLNKNVPGRTKVEWQATNYVEKREHFRQRNTEYYTANQAHLITKHACSCGGKYTTQKKAQHNRTKIHTAWLAQHQAL